MQILRRLLFVSVLVDNAGYAPPELYVCSIARLPPDGCIMQQSRRHFENTLMELASYVELPPRLSRG
jgi:hypothetical protein